jgi:hypothetical protein
VNNRGLLRLLAAIVLAPTTALALVDPSALPVAWAQARNSVDSANARAQRADPTQFLLSDDELPGGFVRQRDRDDDRSSAASSLAYRVYWRYNPEVAPNDITSLHMGIWVYDTVEAAAREIRAAFANLSEDFEFGEPTEDVGDEAFRLWHSIAEDGPRQAEAWYILFRVGPVVARSRWGDYDDLPNYEHALDIAQKIETKIQRHYD